MVCEGEDWGSKVKSGFCVSVCDFVSVESGRETTKETDKQRSEVYKRSLQAEREKDREKTDREILSSEF